MSISRSAGGSSNLHHHRQTDDLWRPDRNGLREASRRSHRRRKSNIMVNFSSARRFRLPAYADREEVGLLTPERADYGSGGAKPGDLFLT
jgi:hypothetical protein